MVPGLLLPLAGWAASPPATGWQLTPACGILARPSTFGPWTSRPHAPWGDIDTLQGSAPAVGALHQREVDDPGMVELLYSHRSPRCPRTARQG